MIFLVLSGNMIFLFPENIILFFRRIMKDDLSQEIHGNEIFSSNVLKRWSFQIIALQYDLSCCIIKKDFLYPENTILFFRRKMKDDLSLKKWMELWYFLQMPRKHGLSKKRRAGIWSFLYIWKDRIFFWKIWYFFFRQKMKDDLSQEIHGYVIFSVYMYKCDKYDTTFLQKNPKDDLLPKKYT